MRFARFARMKYREKVLAKRMAAVLVLSTVSIFCFKAVRSGPRADNTPPQRVLESKPSKPLRTVAIQRVKAGSFDAKEFFDEFGDNVPVIVEGEVKHHPAYNMSLNTLKDLCGDGLVETSRYDATSGSWGGLVDTKYMHLKEFVDDHLLNDTDRDGEPPRYLTAGLSLLQVCPKLDLYTPVPKYVSLSVYPIDLDHNKQTNGKRNQIFHPDMFIGNKGTKTEMHVDVSLGPFWMSVYLGSKTFRVVTYWDAVRHFDMYNKKGRGNRLIDQNARSQRWERSRYDDSTGKFEKRRMEIWNPDLDWFPELDNVTVWEGTVNAGDWIYLPSASLHGVRNDDASWGVTINALYPATVDNQATICANSGFKIQCQRYVYDSLCPLENFGITGDETSIDTEEKLRQCYAASPLLKRLGREFEEGRAKEMPLHEMAGYSDYSTWCTELCNIHQKYLKEKPNFFGELDLEGFQYMINATCSQCNHRL